MMSHPLQLQSWQLQQVPLPPKTAIGPDYELAESIGTREAWHFFLSTYPDGFNAKLALASAQACRRGTRGMAVEKVPLRQKRRPEQP
jgi:hypothetical protein